MKWISRTISQKTHSLFRIEVFFNAKLALYLNCFNTCARYIDITFIVPIIYKDGTNTCRHCFNRKNLSWPISPFRGLNGGYRGLMGIDTFLIFQLKATIKRHHEPLKTLK